MLKIALKNEVDVFDKNEDGHTILDLCDNEVKETMVKAYIKK